MFFHKDNTSSFFRNFQDKTLLEKTQVVPDLLDFSAQSSFFFAADFFLFAIPFMWFGIIIDICLPFFEENYLMYYNLFLLSLNDFIPGLNAFDFQFYS